MTTLESRVAGRADALEVKFDALEAKIDALGNALMLRLGGLLLGSSAVLGTALGILIALTR